MDNWIGNLPLLSEPATVELSDGDIGRVLWGVESLRQFLSVSDLIP